MKTTIELPDALASEAKQLALDEGTSLRELVISGLRRELDDRRGRVKVDFVFPTAGGTGLVADLDPRDALARSYGLPS